MGSWWFFREWVWNLRTGLCCIASRKWSFSRVPLQELDILRYLRWTCVSGRMVDNSEDNSSHLWLISGKGKYVLMYLLFNSDIANLLLKTNWGGVRDRKPKLVIFAVWSILIVVVFGGGGVCVCVCVCRVGPKIFFRIGWNCIFCVPGFIQGWRTHGEFKISSFRFWC